MTDFRALCAELVAYIDYVCEDHGLPGSLFVDRARAALAQPEQQGPTDEEILALSQWHEVSYTLTNGSVIYPLQEGADMKDAVLSFTRAVLQRWGAPASQSVAELTVQDCADMDKHRMAFIDEDSSGLITLDGCFTREELLELAQTRPAP
jgi:hypothetical protein